jgi:hypothetical protein
MGYHHKRFPQPNAYRPDVMQQNAIELSWERI